jgi:anti-anti-sigma factor
VLEPAEKITSGGKYTMAINENEIKVENRDEVTVLDVRGDVTASSEAALTGAYQEASNAGARRLLFRLDENAYIDSGGIMVLIRIMADARSQHQLIALTGVNKHYKKIFNMVGITKFAVIYNTLDIAVEQMSREELKSPG